LREIFILHIETSQELCGVALSKNGLLIGQSIEEDQSNHSTNLHQLIDDCLKSYQIKPSNLDAISFSGGPGSYTGLRIGLSSAKGMCYALSIPLISISTLELMAVQFVEEVDFEQSNPFTELCPMIDARRMEVYKGSYDLEGNQLNPDLAEIINDNHFEGQLEKILFGSGLDKLLKLGFKFDSDMKISPDFVLKPKAQSKISYKKYLNFDFVELVNFEPFYLKEFYTPSQQKSN